MRATTLAFCEPNETRLSLRQEGHQVFIPDLGPLPLSLRRHFRRGQQTAVCGVEDVSQSSWPIFVRVMPAQVSSAESAPLLPLHPGIGTPSVVPGFQSSSASSGSQQGHSAPSVPKRRKLHREAMISWHLNLGLHFLVSRHSLDPCPSGPKAEANLHCRMDSDRVSPRFFRWLGGV